MSRLTQLSTIWTALILIAAVAEVQEKTAQKPIPCEATRYDGKTFEEWRDSSSHRTQSRAPHRGHSAPWPPSEPMATRPKRPRRSSP